MPWLLVLLALLLAWTPSAHAWDLSGRKELIALTRDQQRIVLGNVDFSPLPDGSTRFTLTMDYHVFVDHFLSMKEFKCLQAPDEVLCHVPYPYKHPATVTTGNYAWLEHQLLFLFKQPRDFGAKLWNGLYFRMEQDADGLVGLPQAVDLNLISAPPDDLNTPPYKAITREDVAPGAHWIERLLIR